MHAPQQLMNVWQQFRHFPMETLTKVWYYVTYGEQKQRSVAQMKAHYAQYGITGNCFDLAFWLQHELEAASSPSYIIGDNHVAVIAQDAYGYRYLCDLGDQWIQPICVDVHHPNFTNEAQVGFFAGAHVQVEVTADDVTILYHRPNGKTSTQTYTLHPTPLEQLHEAAQRAQRTIKPAPLVECRLYDEDEVKHWEFYDFNSFTSSMAGLVYDERCATIDEWVARICAKTNYAEDVVRTALMYYKGDHNDSDNL